MSYLIYNKETSFVSELSLVEPVNIGSGFNYIPNLNVSNDDLFNYNIKVINNNLVFDHKSKSEVDLIHTQNQLLDLQQYIVNKELEDLLKEGGM